MNETQTFQTRVRNLLSTCCKIAMLSACVISSSVAQNLPARATPRGMTSLGTNGSGRIFAAQLSGGSATKTFKTLILGVKSYFDTTPQILNAFRNARDTQIQASFRASVAGVPVLGLIGVATQGSKAKAVVLFDSTRVFGNSLGRLLTVASGGGATNTNIALTRVTFPDNSGSIGLAPGWELKYASQGAADIAGPIAGSGMSIGANLTVPYTSSDPAQALAIAAKQMAQQQGVKLQFKLIDAKPTQWQNGNASFVRYRTIMNGQSMDYFGLFVISPFDGNNVFFYSSYIQAPTKVFAKILPVALKIWGSWSVNPAVFAKRLLQAAQSMRETGELLTSINTNRQQAFEGINAGWSEYIRDVATLEDNAQNRAQLDASFAARVVQDNPNDYRIVPPSELLRR
jgi:hypothetical protein